MTDGDDADGTIEMVTSSGQRSVILRSAVGARPVAWSCLLMLVARKSVLNLCTSPSASLGKLPWSPSSLTRAGLSRSPWDQSSCLLFQAVLPPGPDLHNFIVLWSLSL